MLDLTVIILTYNEEIHIKRCLNNLKGIVRDIFIVDSYSTDKTLEIARKYPHVHILQNRWINYATQFNWALEHAQIKTEWVLRLDADEYLTDELKMELENKLPDFSEAVTGGVFPLRRVFLGRVIRRGMNQVRLLRLFRYGKAKCEVRLMDEHIELLEGHAVDFENEFVDDNLNNLSWWTQKHVDYAIREAVDLLDMEFDLTGAAETDKQKNISQQALEKRMKKHQYARKPLFWRSFAYFVYRYFFKLGFLEGKEGFLWHFLQGWWYRTLVDAKIYEIKKSCGGDRQKIKAYLWENYNIVL
ncbi:MAG: glycosyltransferase family 2 protein [Coprobacter sp.]|nr:glycosyltransferase family 2 protein [Coprobacter sp.]